MLDRSSPLKSMLTSGSSVTPRRPFIGPFAAALSAAFAVSAVTGRVVMATKSMTLTVAVGTRSEKPSKRPFSSGMTSGERLRRAGAWWG